MKNQNVLKTRNYLVGIENVLQLVQSAPYSLQRGDLVQEPRL